MQYKLCPRVQPVPPFSPSRNQPCELQLCGPCFSCVPSEAVEAEPEAGPLCQRITACQGLFHKLSPSVFKSPAADFVLSTFCGLVFELLRHRVLLSAQDLQ